MKTIDFYNFSEDRDYGKGESISPRELACIQIIKDYFPDNGTFADIGCGNGIMLKRLNDSSNKKIKYIGFDYSKFQLDILNKRKIKHNITVIKTLHGDLEKKIDLISESVDFIFLGEVIEHMYNPDFLIKECYRLLKKDGYILLTTPNFCSWYNRILFLFGIQPIFYETSVVNSLNGCGILKRFKKSTKPVGHVRLFTKDAIIDILKSYQFNIKKVTGVTTDILPKIVQKIESILFFFSNSSSILIVLAKK